MNKKEKRDWANYSDDLDRKFLSSLYPDVQGYLDFITGTGTYDDPYISPISREINFKKISFPFKGYKLLQGKVFLDPTVNKRYYYYTSKDLVPRDRVLHVSYMEDDTKVTAAWDLNYKPLTYEEAKQYKKDYRKHCAEVQAQCDAARLRNYANSHPTWLDDNVDNVVDVTKMLMTAVIIIMAFVAIIMYAYLACTQSIAFIAGSLMLGTIIGGFYVAIKREDEELKNNRQELKQPNLK